MHYACHITGQSGDAAHMLRFVRAPDGDYVADLADKLPDLAVYVLPRASVVEKLGGAGLAGQVGAQLRTRALAQLGMARKAGKLVLGFSKTEAALNASQLHLLLAAHDGAAHGTKALGLRARALDVAICAVFGRDELGMALGRANVIHAGATDAVWAARLQQHALQVEAYAAADADRRDEV